MTEQQAQEIIKDNPVVLAKIIQFWTWFEGLNKFLKWLAYIALPILLALWALTHRSKQ